jgi:hypothetical protein
MHGMIFTWSSILRPVATGIVIFSLGVAFFIFCYDLPNFVFIAIMIMVSTVGMFGLLEYDEITWINALRDKK